jgi:hypothetical protein
VGFAPNPFTPLFGSEPLFLAGRDRLIAAFRSGLRNGVGDPNRSTVLIGPRGAGKTVLLNRLTSEAEQEGWIAVKVAAAAGMLDSILEQARARAAEILPAPKTRRVTGVAVAGASVSTELVGVSPPSWRLQMEELLDQLRERGSGLVIAVDELDVGAPGVVDLVRDFQFFVGDRRQVALVMAGLPGRVLQMFRHDAISFVRRSFQHRLGPVGLDEAAAAIEQTITVSGRTITPAALELTVRASEGFPFLIQLVGYHVWEQSSAPEIGEKDAADGIAVAQQNMGQMILDTTIRELSRKDLLFLYAMAEDDDDSSTRDIGQRLGATPALVSRYRSRLLAQGVIGESGYGRVRFELPMLREYLQGHPELKP